MIRATIPSFTRNLLVLESRDAILALAPLLEQLAAQCDQPDALHWLPYFLDPAVVKHRHPYLVLILRPEENAEKGLRVEDVEGAALLFEFQVLGLGTGVVCTGDAAGLPSVIAPKGSRASVAAAVSRALLERGMDLVLTTYVCEGEPEGRSVLAGSPGVLWASRNRSVRRLLPTGDVTTPHTIHGAFEEEFVSDLLMQRMSPRATLTCMAARWLSRHVNWLSKSTFVGEMLSQSVLPWAESPSFATRQHASVASPVHRRKVA